jgi:hypothetical protein
MGPMFDNETIAMRDTVIGGKRYPDDYPSSGAACPLAGSGRVPISLRISTNGGGAAMFTASHRSAAITDRAPQCKV